MKEKEIKKTIIFAAVAVLTALALALAVYFALKFSFGKDVSAETDTEKDRQTEYAPPTTDKQTHETLLPLETSEELTEAETTESRRDISDPAFFEDAYREKSREIAEWVEANTPVYRTEIETDGDGNVVRESAEEKREIAFFCLDLETGEAMKYNEDHVFFSASVIKEPYILYALKEVEKAKEEGNTDPKYDLESIFTYTEDKYKEGSGVILKSEYGTQYTYLDLFRLAITQSDNIAFSFIRNLYGKNGFNDFSKSLGVYNPTKSLYKISAAEAAAYFAETYEYFESGSEYALMLKKWMMSTNHRIMIPSALKPTPVAHKYGWDEKAYHDSAVVFDAHPYVLVILTELDNGSGADNKFIRELAKKLDEAHREVWSVVENGTDVS